MTDEGYDDGIACTVSVCNPGNPMPTANNIPQDGACNDFNDCTTDVCDALMGCLYVPNAAGTPDATMDDGNPCTDLRCVTGATVNVNDDTNVPDDGLPCTTQTCSAGVVNTTINAGWCLVNGECIADGATATSAPCGVCDATASQTTVDPVLLYEGFESGSAPGWAVNITSGTVPWQVTNHWTGSEVTGTYALWFGFDNGGQYDYNDGFTVTATITSPSFDVPANGAVLTFDARLETQDTAGLDIFTVEVNDGFGWTTLWSENNTGLNLNRRLSLSPYAGSTVTLRFAFDSVDNTDNDKDGVIIDEVKVETACCFTNGDCDDSDACTVDTCAADGACAYEDICAVPCTDRNNVLYAISSASSMQTDDGTGQSRWEAVANAISVAQASVASKVNAGAMLIPSETAGSCSVHPVPTSVSPLWNAANTPPGQDRAPEWWFDTAASDIASYLNAYTPSGNSPLATGILRAGEVYASGHPTLETGPKYVIFITDGGETCATGDPAAEVLTLNTGQDIETFVIGYGPSVDVAMATQAAINGGHAKLTGAAYYAVSDEGELVTALREIFDIITAEACDGTDNDCDGSVDEGVPDLTCVATCNAANYPGLQVCSAGSYGPCQLPAIPEVCDGIDNDCDGSTDEGYGVGGSCSDGVGACEVAGTWVCNTAGDGVECTAVGSSPAAEICDGIDNDCNGNIDEGFANGMPCDGADSDSCANGTYTCTADGSGVECVNETTSVSETCNGLDDDCDGLTDEDFAIGVACDGSDTDQCQEGVRACDGSGGVTCTDATGDDVELCNGIDDDCDGLTDETFDVGLPCDTADADLCYRGTRTCLGDGSGTECTGDLPLGVEVCNGIDDDCDGSYDEMDAGGCIMFYEDKDDDGHGIGAGLCLCSPQSDYTATINDDCDDTEPTVYPGSVELCDGLDQDCDGLTDEHPSTDVIPWVGDCYTGPLGTEGVGICTTGTGTCSGGAWTSCVGEVTPEPVDGCGDSLDNDCNGLTDDGGVGCVDYYKDEDMDGVAAGPPVCLCNPSGIYTIPTAPATPDCNDLVNTIYPGAAEVCNATDDDCDGSTDEDAVGNPIEQSCYTGPPATLGVGTCTGGTQQCNGATGTWGPCGGEILPTAFETCDGLDTDCDGLADDEEPNGAGGTSDDEGHPCENDVTCTGGVSCYCIENQQTSAWQCVSD